MLSVARRIGYVTVSREATSNINTMVCWKPSVSVTKNSSQAIMSRKSLISERFAELVGAVARRESSMQMTHSIFLQNSRTSGRTPYLASIRVSAMFEG